MINHQGVGHMKGRKSVVFFLAEIAGVAHGNSLNCEIKMGRYVMITFMKV
jgi:hypothetical protein